MGVLQALRRASGALKRAPGLLVSQLTVFTLLVPQLLLQSSYPLVLTLYLLGISTVFLLVTPFIQGGMLGVTDEALTTRSSLSRFVAGGKTNYLSLLIAYALLLVISGVIGTVGVATGFGAFLTHNSTGTTFIGLATIAELLYLVVAFFIQFYGQAIVIDGASTIDLFRRSYYVVRGNLLATVGYMLLALVIGVLSGGIYTGVSLLASADAASAAGLPTLSTPLLIVVGLLAVVIGSVVSAFLLTSSTAVYDELTG